MASNVENTAATERDPGNRLLWKREMRRMEAEVFRDSLLQLSGRLRWATGGGPMEVKSQDPSPTDLANNQKFYEQSDRRSVYLPVVRSNVYDLFTLLDFPNAAESVGNRVTTIRRVHNTLLAERIVLDDSARPRAFAAQERFCCFPLPHLWVPFCVHHDS